MKITKYGHSCVLVEVAQGQNSRIALFDPGAWSSVPVETIDQLDDIFISHIHQDHCDVGTIKQLLRRFPHVRITAPADVAAMLRDQGIGQATDTLPTGARSFPAPHEAVEPFGTVTPDEIGIHFMDTYSHPGDSHSFGETMAVLALPIVAPWGSTRRAAELALELRPTYVLPVHDWFLSDDARTWTHTALEHFFAEQGITLLRAQPGVSLDVSTN